MFTLYVHIDLGLSVPAESRNAQCMTHGVARVVDNRTPKKDRHIEKIHAFAWQLSELVKGEKNFTGILHDL
jgi:hypothetical protein